MRIVNQGQVPHRCETELREFQSHRFPDAGVVVECSCGLKYELRSPAGFFKWLFGVGFGNVKGRYFPHTYWHGLGKAGEQ